MIVVSQIGEILFSIPEWLGRLLLLFWDSVVDILRLLLAKYNWRLFRELRRATLIQVWYTALQIVALIVLIGIGTGAILLMGAYTTLRTLGAEDIFLLIFRHLLVLELLPLLLSVIVIARSATAITADVASQVINGEIEVMRVHNMSANLLVVVPRILAVPLSLFVLEAFFMLSLLGSMVILAPFQDGVIAHILHGMQSIVTTMDIVWVLLKTMVFGVLIALISCYKGLNVFRDIRELPRASSQAVVLCMITVFLVDFVFAIGMWV